MSEVSKVSKVSEAEKVVLLEKKVEELEKKIDRVFLTVYNLLGGLFNQESQSDIIDWHLDILFGKECKPLEKEKLPTTRQGDNNEKRLKELEQKVADFLFPNVNKDTIRYMEEKEESLS